MKIKYTTLERNSDFMMKKEQKNRKNGRNETTNQIKNRTLF